MGILNKLIKNTNESICYVDLELPNGTLWVMLCRRLWQPTISR